MFATSGEAELVEKVWAPTCPLMLVPLKLVPSSKRYVFVKSALLQSNAGRSPLTVLVSDGAWRSGVAGKEPPRAGERGRVKLEVAEVPVPEVLIESTHQLYAAPLAVPSLPQKVFSTKLVPV